MTVTVEDECPTCSSMLCPPGSCNLYNARPHHTDIVPAHTVADPEWPGGRPIDEAMA